MDFDHARGEKKYLISTVARKHISRENLDAELEKCDLVCANCHRIRTFERLRAVGPAEKTAVYETANNGAHPLRPSSFAPVV
jgi:hypothetical protein